MARRRHPKQDVEKALQYAEELGCLIDDNHNGHRWGWVIGADGSKFTIFCTPRSPSSHGKRIRQWADKNHP